MKAGAEQEAANEEEESLQSELRRRRLQKTMQSTEFRPPLALVQWIQSFLSPLDYMVATLLGCAPRNWSITC